MFEIENSQEYNSDVEHKFQEFIKVLIRECSLKELKTEDYPVEWKSLQNANKIYVSINNLANFLDELADFPEKLKLYSSVSKVIILESFFISIQFSNADQPWSNLQISFLCTKIINNLLKITNSDTIENFLYMTSDNYSSTLFFKNGFLYHFLTEFSKKFDKRNWKRHPSYVEAYTWILYKIEKKFLSDYQQFLLPPALFILDDWQQSNKVIGADALYYILKNCPSAQLRLYGWSDVIHEALRPNIFSREADILRHILPPLIQVAKVIDEDPKNMLLLNKPYYDCIFDHLLKEMQYDEMLDRRSIYIKSLYHIITGMGISTIRWINTILNIFDNYLKIHDKENFEDLDVILDSLKDLIIICWPCIENRVEGILKMILRLAYDLETREISTDKINILSSKMSEIVHLLLKSFPETTKRLCDELNESKVWQISSINKICGCVFES